MDEKKNQRLAEEMTDFCLQHLNSPAKKFSGSKPLILSLLVSLFALSFGDRSLAAPRSAIWFA